MDQKVPERSEGPLPLRSPGEVWECELRIGLVPEAEHWQASLTVLDPRTGVPLLMVSDPHGDVKRVRAWVEKWLDDAWMLLEDLSTPF